MGLAFLIDFVMLSLLYAVIERLETIPYVAVLAVYFALIPFVARPKPWDSFIEIPLAF